MKPREAQFTDQGGNGFHGKRKEFKTLGFGWRYGKWWAYLRWFYEEKLNQKGKKKCQGLASVNVVGVSYREGVRPSHLLREPWKAQLFLCENTSLQFPRSQTYVHQHEPQYSHDSSMRSPGIYIPPGRKTLAFNLSTKQQYKSRVPARRVPF